MPEDPSGKPPSTDLAPQQGNGPTKPTQKPEVKELLDALPEPERERIEQFFAMAQTHGPLHNPIIDKLTPEHITKVIDGVDTARGQHFVDRKEGRRHDLHTLMVVLIFVLALCGIFLFAKQPEYLDKVIAAVLGFAGGYGFGRTKQRS